MSKFFARLRSRRSPSDLDSDQQFVRPVREADTRPPLRLSPLPLVLPDHQVTIEKLGWTVVSLPQPLPQPSHNGAAGGLPSNQTVCEELSPPSLPAPGPHPLQQAAQDLFQASQLFFHLPVEQKQKWHKENMGSEEGWSHIPGEKEMLALRTLDGTPELLQAPAKRYWDLMGAYLDTFLGRLSTRLDLPDEESSGLRKYVGNCKTMGQARTATMLRLFRYEGHDRKVVAEPHADLGLLSCVMGTVPGLEVWGGRNYYPIEKDYLTPLGNATITVGRELEALSNRRFPAGGHRVISYGPGEMHRGGDGFRYSIVFVLRAAEEVDVDTAALETAITGPFDRPVKGLKVGEWYQRIQRAHFNINIGMQDREIQRKNIVELRHGREEAAARTEDHGAAGKRMA